MKTVLNPAAASLIGEAVEWRLIGLLLERPTAAWREAVPYLAHEVRDDELRAAALGAVESSSEGEHLRLFGPGGVVSPREVAHVRTRDPGHLLAQLGVLYDAFAYRPRSEETADHVAVEAGCVGYLRLKQAFALTCGATDFAESAQRAADLVVERHLSAFVEPIADRLGDDTYMSDVVALLLRRTGPRRPDAEGGWTPDGLDDACLTCAGA